MVDFCRPGHIYYLIICSIKNYHQLHPLAIISHLPSHVDPVNPVLQLHVSLATHGASFWHGGSQTTGIAYSVHMYITVQFYMKHTIIINAYCMH